MRVLAVKDVRAAVPHLPGMGIQPRPHLGRNRQRLGRSLPVVVAFDFRQLLRRLIAGEDFRDQTDFNRPRLLYAPLESRDYAEINRGRKDQKEQIVKYDQLWPDF